MILRFRFQQINAARKRKRDFCFIQNVKQNHIVTTIAQNSQGVYDFVRIGQQIGHQHHQAAMPNHGRHTSQVASDVRRARRLAALQHGQNLSKMRPSAARRQTCSQFIVKRHESNGVLLMNHQITD